MDLTVLAGEWAKKLKSLEHAGGVIAPEAELPVITKQMRRELSNAR